MPRPAERFARMSTQNYHNVAMLMMGHLTEHARARMAGYTAAAPGSQATRHRANLYLVRSRFPDQYAVCYTGVRFG